MEFHLRHTVYYKVTADSAAEAAVISTLIADAMRDTTKDGVVIVHDIDVQKNWELNAQEKYQKRQSLLA